ncbi:MAG TPA: alanine dehydrogenase, partial [Firmicutes bacterium]|nr:alanine dehydrogenase [Bacillota bacterium]
AYETVQLTDGSLPLLTPMSEVAGRMAVQIGAHFLEKRQGGRGVLLGGVPGVPPAEVVIIGGGTVGTNAAKIALGMGARVSVVDINAERLRYLDDLFRGQVTTLVSNAYNLGQASRRADLLIGAVLIPGARAPQLVTEDMVREMKPRAVIVDVAIDQGGCVATMDRVTTHSSPTFLKHGVLHYAVANIPGAVPRTSTIALTNTTLPWVLRIVDSGWEDALRRDPALARGLNVCRGQVTHAGVAEAHGFPYVPPAELGLTQQV